MKFFILFGYYISMLTILWFRRDLRRHDNPALAEAAARGPVIPAYVLDPSTPIGGAGRWWLHHSLAALERDLSPLWLGKGLPTEILPRLAREAGANAVVWTAGTTPREIQTDKDVQAALNHAGITAKICPANLLFDATTINSGGGTPYKVFTAFWRTARTRAVAAPFPPPYVQTLHPNGGLTLDELELLPQPNWAMGWENIWRPGERGAFTQMDAFIAAGLSQYEAKRDYPIEPNISRLSAHLHWGELSVRLLWNRMHLVPNISEDNRDKFLSEVGWREFAHYLMHHWPDTVEKNWNPSFDSYPWREGEEAEADLAAWQRGMTGYPMVDAGMRELWHTGFMHNRVRMVAASFLTKHLRIHWRRGVDWFSDTLVDADRAVNTASWQWVAGCGADAAPYFRIFNPLAQGAKYDPDGAYIRHWCPELADIPTALLHSQDSTAPKQRSAQSRDQSYPLPIVAHDTARVAALDGYQRLRIVSRS